MGARKVADAGILLLAVSLVKWQKRRKAGFLEGCLVVNVFCKSGYISRWVGVWMDGGVDLGLGG